MNKIQRPDDEILNLQGIYFDELGDAKRSEKAYLEANKATSTWGGPLFNLALSFRKRGLHDKALETINRAIKKIGRKGPYLTLKAMCLASLEDEDEKRKALSDAMHSFDPPEILDDWELGWYTTAADLFGDDEYISKAKKENKKRRKTGMSLVDDDVLRPAVSGDLVKKESL